ncbi:MAG: class I adenylate-forming enzyme family protein [Bauldia sp.]
MLSVVAGIKAAAERNAFAPALITGARLVTYGELLGVVARVSNHLADRGLRPGTKVFLNIGDADFRLTVIVACLHCGLIPFIFENIAGAGDDIDHDLVIGAEVLWSPDLKPDIVIGQSVLSGGGSDPKLREFPDRGPEEVLFVGSTTGTTGRPKLVAETAGAFDRKRALRVPPRGGSIRTAMLNTSDRFLSTLGDLTKYGFSLGLQALMAGATHVRSLRDFGDLLKLINIVGVTTMMTTPDVASALMDRMDDLPARCPSVRWIGLSGSLFHRALIDRLEHRFPGATLAVLYGTAEVGRITAGTVTSADFEVGYVGELHPEVRVASTGTRADPQPITILNSPDRHSPRYVRGKLIPVAEATYTLPDLGFLEGPHLYLVGRDDEVFNADGNKTAFSIIEGDLRAAPGVTDVGIVAGNLVGDFLGLVVAVAGAGPLDVAALADRVAICARAPGLRRRIHLFQIASVPRNATGKIDRNAIARAYRLAAEPVSSV